MTGYKNNNKKNVNKTTESFDNVTLNQALLKFPQYLFREGKSNSTKVAYMNDLNHFKEFLQSHLNNKIRYVNAITLIEIMQYKDYMLLEVSKENGLSISTIKRRFNSLKTFFNFLDDMGYAKNIIFHDNFGNKKLAKNPPKSYLPNYLKMSEIKDIIDIAQASTDKNKYRDVAILQVLANFGCRRNDLLNTRWNEIDWYNNTVTIMREKNQTADVLPLPRSIKTALMQYMETLKNPSGYVFQSRQSNHLSPSAFTSIINKYIDKSGIRDKKDFKITSHSFRHSFITACVRSNLPFAKIKSYTGHKDANSLEPYTHLVYEDLMDVSSTIEKALS